MLLHTGGGHAVMAVMKIFKTVGGQMSQKLRQASVFHKVSGDILLFFKSFMKMKAPWADVRLAYVRHQPCRSNVLRQWLEQQYATKLTVVLCEKYKEQERKSTYNMYITISSLFPKNVMQILSLSLIKSEGKHDMTFQNIFA